MIEVLAERLIDGWSVVAEISARRRIDAEAFLEIGVAEVVSNVPIS